MTCQLLLFRHCPVMVQGIFPDFIYLAVSSLRWNGEIHHVRILRVYRFSPAITVLRVGRMETSSSVYQIGQTPCRARPFGIIIFMRVLSAGDAHHGDGRIPLLVGGNLPHPIAQVRRRIHYGIGIGTLIGIRLIHGKLTVCNDRQSIALNVFKNRRCRHRPVGTLHGIDIDYIKIHPVRLFVVRMPCRIGHIQFVLAVAIILGVWTRTGRLDHLIGSPLHPDIVILIGQRKLGYRRMPVNATPAQIEMCGVIAQDKRRRIGCVGGSLDALFLTEGSDVTGTARHAVIERRFVGMAGVDNQHALIRKYQKSGIVMVIGLEVGTYQHFITLSGKEVVLRSLDVPVYIDITDIRRIDCTLFILIMKGPRVGKPAPCPFRSHRIAGECVLSLYAQHTQGEQYPESNR